MSDSLAVAVTDYLSMAIVTYLIHSTLFLVGCWLMLRCVGGRSPTLVDRGWKLAAVAGLITTATQLMFPVGLAYDIEWFAKQHSAHASPSAVPGEERDLVLRDTRQDLGRESDWIVTGSFPSQNASVIPSKPSLVGDQPSDESSPVVAAPPAGKFVKMPLQQAHGDPPALEVKEFIRRWEMPSWTTVLAYFLAISITLGMLRTLVQTLILSRRVSESQSIESGRVRRSLDRLIKKNRLACKVRLLSCQRQREPVAFGWRTWTILVPSEIERQLNDDQLTAMLAHELAHFVRGDTKWLFIGRLLCNCLAFQPLNFVARRRWRQASEYLCDQWAVDQGTSPLTLARCLTTLATHRSRHHASRRMQAVSLAATGTKKTVVDRVERLVTRGRRRDPWSCRFRVNLCRVLAIGVIVAVAVGGPRTRWVAAESQSTRIGVDHQRGKPAIDPTFLDKELLALRKDIEQLKALATSAPLSTEVSDQLRGMADAMSSIEQRHMELKQSFSKGESK